MCRFFPRITYHLLPFPSFMESTLIVFLPEGVFLPCNQGLDFNINARIQSIHGINQDAIIVVIGEV